MIYYESPKEYKPDSYSNGKFKNIPSLFLAGGITDCPDWQKEMTKKLNNTDIIILNPRRENFDINEKDAAKKQIAWEYRHLRYASAISFWFPKETLCPIVLFELGYWFNRSKEIFIGVHPEYKRKEDVYIQVSLTYPDFKFVNNINDLTKQIADWAERQ